MNNFVVISGCSGGGKSTLLQELRARGLATVEEPGRRVIAEEGGKASPALPWTNAEAFARRAIEMSLADRAQARAQKGWVFFDRGLIDAASALQHLTGEPAVQIFGQAHRNHHRVFITPPWPEIYKNDADRRHNFGDALEEYERLLRDYASLGYKLTVLPKTSVQERAHLILKTLRTP